MTTEMRRHLCRRYVDRSGKAIEREYGKAVREIMLLADRVNECVDAHKPWELAKHEAQPISAGPPQAMEPPRGPRRRR